MTAEAVVELQRTLEIDRVVRGCISERRPCQGLWHDVGGETSAIDLDHGETATVDRDAVPHLRVLEHPRRGNPQTHATRGGLDRIDASQLFDQSREHGLSLDLASFTNLQTPP